MALDLSQVVPIYQSRIDDIINQLGKNVTLYFKSTVTNVATAFDDPVRGDIMKPAFKTTVAAPAPTITYNTRVLKALVKWNPKDFEMYGLTIKNAAGIIRIKTFLTDVPDILRCDYMVPNSDVRGIIDTKFKLIREPIPVGLQTDRYAVSYWERV